mmetsp:Transcript_4358/g.7357  ORF Transcript_4358/g.7357 Transcript_4358/m.7357 type:complete len:206 (-) Transcript_4358:175-792(-)
MKNFVLAIFLGVLAYSEVQAVRLNQQSAAMTLESPPVKPVEVVKEEKSEEKVELEKKAVAVAEAEADVKKEKLRKSVMTKKEIKAEEEAVQQAIKAKVDKDVDEFNAKEKLEKKAEKAKKKEEEAKKEQEAEAKGFKIVTVDGNDFAANLKDHHFETKHAPLASANIQLKNDDSEAPQPKTYKTFAEMVESLSKSTQAKDEITIA